jgi:putative tryptophan/tyrosine transport system substrate-binding protein
MPLATSAQQTAKVWRVGVLMDLYPPDANPPQALRQGLRDVGYVEGRNLVIDWRYQLGQSDRLPALAVELVRLKPDIIVADSTVAIRAALQATSTHPYRDGKQRGRRRNRARRQPRAPGRQC